MDNTNKSIILNDHPLVSLDEYVQKLYIDVLTIVSHYKSSNIKKGNSFIQLIMSGVGLTEPFIEHVKNAMQMTQERYGEFVKQCIDNKLTDIFLADCMLIACIFGEPSTMQADLIAEMADTLWVSKERIQHIARIVKSIIVQNEDEYKIACERNSKNINDDLSLQLKCYLRSFLYGIIVNSDDYFWMNSLKDLLHKTNENSLSGIPYEIVVSNKKKVIIEDVKANVGICLYSCEEVIIRNCEVTCVRHNDVKTVTYFNCVFDGKKHNNEVFFWYSSENIIVNIDNCCFMNYSPMTTTNYSCYRLDGRRFLQEMNVSNSKFINMNGGFVLCRNCSNYTFTNCEFINSEKLGYEIKQNNNRFLP